MFAVRRLPALFALLMLGAHFLRSGELLLVLLCLALLVPLFIPRPAAQATVRWVLAFGALVWLWTLAQGIRQRLAFDEPWLRLALILGAVAAFTAWAAWLLRRGKTEEKR
ncbi:hypothetical protein [Geothrix sp. SG200]|uniref:hypothetical protein n=1 Tax=Geothrix sp. SG200 TaxID=2922865 RepID=UPI001FAB952E|nr:hypothetical protein [Geothrix sp. SG200]